jgi:hypothetical protein
VSAVRCITGALHRPCEAASNKPGMRWGASNAGGGHCYLTCRVVGQARERRPQDVPLARVRLGVGQVLGLLGVRVVVNLGRLTQAVARGGRGCQHHAVPVPARSDHTQHREQQLTMTYNPLAMRYCTTQR